jgi:hypothetical protein
MYFNVEAVVMWGLSRREDQPVALALSAPTFNPVNIMGGSKAALLGTLICSRSYFTCATSLQKAARVGARRCLPYPNQLQYVDRSSLEDELLRHVDYNEYLVYVTGILANRPN